MGKLVWTYDNCLEDKLITYFFLSVVLVEVSVPYFFRISPSSFRICLFHLVNQNISCVSFYECFLQDRIHQVL